MKIKFFYTFAAAFIYALPAFAMGDEEPVGNYSSSTTPAVAPSDHSLLLYGGQVGHDIFQSQSKKFVEVLKAGFLFYRNYPAHRREDTLKKVIRIVADHRKKIAQETKSEDPDDFGMFRLEADIEHTTTPLFPPQYAAMEQHIRQSIQEHLERDKWIDEGESRYRVRELESKNWPVCVTKKEMEVYKSALQVLGPLEGEAKQAVDTVLNQSYLADFLYKGNIVKWSDSYVGFQNQLMEICGAEIKRVADQSSDPYQLLGIGFANIPPSPADQASVSDPSLIRMLRIEIEHKLGGMYVPGYGFMGMKLGPFMPLMICHPAKFYLPSWISEYENRLHEAILAKSEDPEEVRDKAGLFQRAFTIAMPLLRGSAADGQWITEALYQSHGYDSIRNTSEVPSVDNLSYMYWTEEAFLAKHRTMVKLIPHAASHSE